MTYKYLKWIFFIVLAVFLWVGCNLSCHGQDAAFFRALWRVESGCRTGDIRGDHGKALGPLQIHRAYWTDAKVQGRYEDCTNYAYSCKVVASYLRRYAPQAVLKRDNQTMARVHNGGPQGAHKASTLAYWKKVQQALDLNVKNK